MQPNVNPAPPVFPGRLKSGPGCMVQMLGVFALALAVIYGIDALLAPWSFNMGGHTHFFPQWTGWGRMHSKIAGDYAVYVSLSPSFRRTGRGGPHITGPGAVCTPRGETFRLRFGGDFEKLSGSDLQGKKAYLYGNRYSAFSGSTAPSIEFRGKWNNPDLVLDDQGSINRAFDPDGALARNTHMRPYIQEVVPLTLHEGTHAEFDAACAAIAKH
jgi:hypothetical protein